MSGYTSNGRPIYLPGASFELGPVGAANLSPDQVAARWKAKADAVAGGWMLDFAQLVTMPGAVLCLAVAQHETLCGDAWPGENNWGAVQYRSLKAPEAQVLMGAGLKPDPANVAAARKAIADAVAAGTIVADPLGALHVDSSPRIVSPSNPRGWYWVLFRAFPSEAAGASFFLNILCGKSRPDCRKTVDVAWQGDWDKQCQSLAAAMYATGYYEGFHDPTKPGGKEANIADYAGSLARIAGPVAAALATWVNPATPPVQEQARAANAQAVAEDFDPRSDDPGPGDPTAA